jgi:hypothetical protein
MTHCKNCNNPINENFCANCGQAAVLKRIDKHYISHEILHLLHFEKGFFYTAKELSTRPGHSIREFINDNRHKHMKPVVFLIVTSLVYTLIAHFFHADTINNSKEKLEFGQSSVNAIQHWVQAHLGYSNIMMGVFIAMGVQLLFRKYKYNFFEIMVLLCFVMGQGMLLLAFLAPFVGILGTQTYMAIVSLIGLVYPAWAIGQFFDATKIGSYIKAFFAYFLGYVLFYIAIVIVGLTTDLIMKMWA